jgi:modulator of FtsH protease HflK
MMFLERLLDLIVAAWDRMAPFVVVEAWENVAILRWGRYVRTLTPGFHWKWPLVEDSYGTVVTITTTRLPHQTVTTSDGKIITCAAIIRYSIRDIRPYYTEITDQKDVLIDTAMGAVRQAIREATLEQTLSEPPERRVLELMRRNLNEYGFKIHAVTFSTLAHMRTLRLIIGEPPANLDN